MQVTIGSPHGIVLEDVVDLFERNGYTVEVGTGANGIPPSMIVIDHEERRAHGR